MIKFITAIKEISIETADKMYEIQRTNGGAGRILAQSRRHKPVSHYPIPVDYATWTPPVAPVATKKSKGLR